ncbi:10760_t:CDS:2, partial [Cetraspora pellucida]
MPTLYLILEQSINWLEYSTEFSKCPAPDSPQTQILAIRNESRKKRKSSITEEQQLGYRKSESGKSEREYNQDEQANILENETSLACQLTADDSNFFKPFREAVANLGHNYCSI